MPNSSIVSSILNGTYNFTQNLTLNTNNILLVSCVDLRYNNWISLMFFISIFIMVNTKFNITRKIGILTKNPALMVYLDTKNFNERFVAYFVAINLFMFLLQFALEPAIKIVSSFSI